MDDGRERSIYRGIVVSSLVLIIIPIIPFLLIYFAILKYDKTMSDEMCLYSAMMFGFGTGVLVYSGAMASISDSIIESAQLDGITPAKELWYIVLPMIWGTFVTMLVTSLVSFFTNDGNGYAFKGAQFNPQLQTLGYFMYSGTVNGGMGSYPVLSAFGMLMTAIAVPVTLLTRNILTKYGPRTD